MTAADLAVIGGGLSGGALALRAAARGRRVVLVERERASHDKVCGEFLSREALLHLSALGLDPRALGGVPIGRVRLSAGRRTATATLPFEGMGLSRRVLDEALLGRAADAGATILRGRNVPAPSTRTATATASAWTTVPVSTPATRFSPPASTTCAAGAVRPAAKTTWSASSSMSAWIPNSGARWTDASSSPCSAAAMPACSWCPTSRLRCASWSADAASPFSAAAGTPCCVQSATTCRCSAAACPVPKRCSRAR